MISITLTLEIYTDVYSDNNMGYEFPDDWGGILTAD